MKWILDIFGIIIIVFMNRLHINTRKNKVKYWDVVRNNVVNKVCIIHLLRFINSSTRNNDDRDELVVIHIDVSIAQKLNHSDEI